jgi:putative transposase
MSPMKNHERDIKEVMAESLPRSLYYESDLPSVRWLNRKRIEHCLELAGDMTGMRILCVSRRFWVQDMGYCMDGLPPENFNARLREECLNVNGFRSIEHAREVIEAWRMDYNENRPHSTLGFLTPKEFAQKEENMLLENSNAQWHDNRG